MTILITTYILNVIDYLETVYLIQYYGTGVEVNPIMRYIFEMQCGWIVKLIVPAILLFLCWKVSKKDRAILQPIGIATACYAFIVFHNFMQIVNAGLLPSIENIL